MEANGDRNRQVADRFSVRLVETLELPAQRDRKALQVTALGLGVKRVEHQAAFARSTDSRDGGESAQWNLDIDPPKVMHADAAQGDRRGVGHGGNSMASDLSFRARRNLRARNDKSRLG